jgi:DNA adenine methylase
MSPDWRTGFRDYTGPNRASIPAHDWASYPNHVLAFTDRLRGVVIENRPAREAIAQQDSPETLFYADPPYPKSTRSKSSHYSCDMTDNEHRELAEQLRAVAGMVVVSGYPCDLYDIELYPDWQRVQRAARGDGAVERIEVL